MYVTCTSKYIMRIIGMFERIIGEFFKELQNRIIGTIKSILGSGLINNSSGAN